MCTVPSPSPAPPPPPPPPPPPELSNVNLAPKKTYPSINNNQTELDPEVCQWALEQKELREACAKNSVCCHEAPYRYKYKYFESIAQVGPTCGLVALSMLVNGEVTAEELLNISRKEGYSNNGEMFSCKNMMKLAEKVFSLAEIDDVTCLLKNGGLSSEETVKSLLNGAVVLVPYDADCNHSPCLRQGHTAHWALICGVLIVENPEDLTETYPNVYALGKHGKSKYLTLWSLDVLDRSNKNLREFSPKKQVDGLIYVLPEGGIGGENGLRDQYLIFQGL